MKNPLGYTIAVALEYILTVNLLYLVLCLLGFAFGICSTIISLTKDIKYDVNGLNVSAKAKDDQRKIAKEFFN